MSFLTRKEFEEFKREIREELRQIGLKDSAALLTADEAEAISAMSSVYGDDLGSRLVKAGYLTVEDVPDDEGLKAARFTANQIGRIRKAEAGLAVPVKE